MGKNVLVLSHPHLQESTMNKYLVKRLSREKLDLEVHHIDRKYPDGNIDVEVEKEMLLSSDLVIFQFPIFWYSAPSSLRKWLEVILEHNWAYGERHALKGKNIALIITTGGSKSSYQYNQSNSRDIESYMYGFYETIRTIRAEYLDSLYIFDANTNFHENRLENEYERYIQFIQEITEINSINEQ